MKPVKVGSGVEIAVCFVWLAMKLMALEETVHIGDMYDYTLSHKPHPSQREEKSATIKLLP